MATQKKYVCAFCTRAFTRSEHKQRHERSHTNEKPFHCTHCSAAFVRRDLLHRHCRTVHSIQMKQNGSDVAHRDSNATPTKNDTTVAKNQAAPYVGVSGTNTTSSTSELTKYSAFKSDTSQFIHLLSVTKKLETLLVSYDPHTDHADVKSTFLIGYTVLDSDKRFPIFGLLGNDLLQFLNSNVSSQKIVDFKICIIYSILATGVANNDDMKHYNEYINKAWSLLITKLIPNYNSNLNPNDQIEILTNLFLLAYTFLTYNSQEFQGNNANCDLIFNYLDEISYIIVSNLSHKTNELIDSNMSLFWSIYVLLSNYMLSTVPPKFYRFFLDKKVNGVVLSTLMENFSRTVVALDDTFDKEIVISTLSNEINLYNHFQKLFIFESKNTLHNSIILVNKTINQIPSHNELFDLFKKKLIVNSPSKFHELLNIYVFNPKSLHNWYLLIASLKEYNSPFDFNRFLAAYLSEPNFERFDQNLRPFFQNDAIKNNLVIVSFPLIFNSKFLNISNESLKIVDFTNFSFKDYQNLRTFIIEWYVTMLKTIIWLFRSQDYSFILQNLVYIVLGKNSEEFKLDEKWFWVLKLKLDSLFEHWLTYVKNDLSDLSSLRSNLNRFTNNMIRELLNYNAFGGAPSLSPITSQRSNSLSMGTLLSSQQSPYNHFSKPLTSLGVELPPTKENNAHFSSYTTITPFNSLPYPQASNYVPHSRTEGSTFPSFMKYEFPYQVNVNPSVAPKSNGSN